MTDVIHTQNYRLRLTFLVLETVAIKHSRKVKHGILLRKPHVGACKAVLFQAVQRVIRPVEASRTVIEQLSQQLAVLTGN